MSKDYVKAVLDYVALTDPTAASVLVAIAERASDDTRVAWPSVAALSRRTRFHRVTVQRALRRLEERGLITTTLGGQDEDGKNWPSIYRLDFDHYGNRIDGAQLPPKRALAERKRARAIITPQSQPVTPPIKKIATVDGQPRDLAAEKQRQLAALRSKITS